MVLFIDICLEVGEGDVGSINLCVESVHLNIYIIGYLPFGMSVGLLKIIFPVSQKQPETQGRGLSLLRARENIF